MRRSQELELNHLKQKMRSLRAVNMKWGVPYLRHHPPQIPSYRYQEEETHHQTAIPAQTAVIHEHQLKYAPREATVDIIHIIKYSINES